MEKIFHFFGLAAGIVYTCSFIFIMGKLVQDADVYTFFRSVHEGNVDLQGFPHRYPPGHVLENKYLLRFPSLRLVIVFRWLPSGYPHEGIITRRARPGAQI